MYKINYKDISYNSGNMANVSIITTNEVEPFKIMSLYCTFVTYTVHHARMLSRFSHVQNFAIPWTVAHQVALSKGFSRQE